MACHEDHIFNGPGGRAAASIIREHILNFMVEDKYFAFTLRRKLGKLSKKLTMLLLVLVLLIVPPSPVHLLSCPVLGRLKDANCECWGYQFVMGRRGKEVVLISEDLEGFKGSSGPLPAQPDIQKIFLSKEDEFLILAWNNYDTCSPHLFAHARKELMDNNDSERCARELVRKALRWRWGTNMKDVVFPLHKPKYAIYGMGLTFQALLANMSEIIYKCRRKRVEFRRWWFYYPLPPHRPFSDVMDFSSPTGGISQCVFATFQHAYIIRHTEDPIKVFVLPVIILICSIIFQN
ncbi:hypothetical protein ACFX2J_035077 [Malus domestica]